ncbi:MAG: glycosyltransferase family 39 protein [Ignavibacteria bacterium]|nr:glycosyltransferase family 39 protein [Ignavibacteria bacterium]
MKSKVKSKEKKKTSQVKYISEFFKIKDEKIISRVPLIIIGIYFLIVLISALTYHQIGDYGVETDFYEGMVYEAKEFLKGNLIIEGYKGPLYPIVLGVLGFVFGDFFRIGVILCVVSAVLFLFFGFKTLEKIFGYDVALGSILLIITNSIFIQYSYSAGTDLFFCALSILSIYFLVKGNQLKNSYIFISGIFASLAFLTRTNGLFLPAAAIVSFLIFKFSSKKYSVLIKHSLIYLAGFVLLNIPWSIYKYIHTGDFFYDRNYTNTAWELYGKGKMSWDYWQSVESLKFTSFKDVIMRDPILFVQEILIKNFYEHFISDLDKLLSLPFAIFLVIGILFLFKRKYLKNEVFFFANILFAFLVLLPAFYSERFSLFLLIGYSAIVMLLLTHNFFKNLSFGSFHSGQIIFAIIFIWSLQDAIKYNSVQIDVGPKEILAIAKDVPDSIKTEANIVVARKPHIAYELNMSYWKFPFVTTYDSLMIWMRSKKANYFFVSAFEVQTLLSYTNDKSEQQKFYFLIDPSIPKEGLEVVTYTIEPPSVLYRIKY